ncbi:hypothetical protein DG70_002380 [Salmonella enterica subsp. enterica serovar Inverness]|nr:hypothetical protein [Salmonella enterica]EDT2910702.1 hypothetical protein [Salmonella enterica subsp. enterica serovar Inverness]
MKKIIASIVLALGLVGTSSASTDYSCEYYSAKVDGATTMAVGGVSYYRKAETGERHKFESVKVNVHDNKQFSFTDPVHDKNITSPKLKDISTDKVKAYGANGKKFVIVYGEDGNPLFRYETDKETYVLMSCTKQ